MFPRVIAAMMADYAKVPRLLPWIKENEKSRKVTFLYLFNYERSLLDSPHLWVNPLAYEAGLLDLRKLGPNNYAYAVKNPALTNIIKEMPAFITNYFFIWQNEALYDWLIEQKVDEDIYNMSFNNNKKCIAEMLKYLDKAIHNVSEYHCGINMLSWPNVWPYIDQRIKSNTFPEIFYERIYANPCSIELIKKAILDGKVTHKNLYLLKNTHPWVVEYCLKNAQNSLPISLAANPGIFTYEDGGELEKHLMELQ